jgi:hypothetical protein
MTAPLSARHLRECRLRWLVPPDDAAESFKLQ